MSALVARSVPRLAMRQWNGGSQRKGVIYYDDKLHKHLPHVVKFSGGRSSGLMLMTLLDNNMLKAERGDVVLFTNTAAEHPATYDFVSKIKRVTEKSGIPFFIAELQTHESVQAGEWRRRTSYRLANDRPYDKHKNPCGYRYRGEVFEETIAWAGMLPTVFTRVCTTLMKMQVTRQFLADWFAARQSIPFMGHKGRPQCDWKILHDAHRRSGGTMSYSDFVKRSKKLDKCSTFRPQQDFADFTKAKIPVLPNQFIQQHIFGESCQLFGHNPAQFITLLGFRAGEDSRYQRMQQRNQGQETPGHITHPPGEYSYAPLYDLQLDQSAVKRFWRKQPSKIRPYLPENMNLSNCVFCFLKGQRSIADIIQKKKVWEDNAPKSLQFAFKTKGTPNSISWWVKLEKSYSRQAKKEGTNGQEAPRFGMFGLTANGYEKIQKNTKFVQSSCNIRDINEDPSINCECTD